MTKRFDQLVGGFAEGDAISQETRRMQQLARDAGYESDIFCPPERVSPGAKELCQPLQSYTGATSDIVVYHYGLATPAGTIFTGSPAKRILRYHNITPATYYDGLDDRLAAQLRDARAELESMAACANKFEPRGAPMLLRPPSFSNATNGPSRQTRTFAQRSPYR
jgi:hypothetical protein